MRFVPSIIISAVAGLLFLIANSTPQESWYTFQDILDKALILGLGGVYIGARTLPYIIGAVIVVGFVFILVFIMQTLITKRRWPTLIPLLIVMGANCVVFSAPGLVFAPSIGDPVQDCELFITGQNGIRIIRYPVDIRLEYGEQQFFMQTTDGGETWSQLTQAFTYNPIRRECQNIRLQPDEAIIFIERSDTPSELEIIEYVSQDNGLTWQVQ